ncbi:caspase-10 isoform X1 [Tupaia chinensis]|uniref:caspase-10 isoform X1 n=1 Tax=Tupaia chinensis TaxID=246437 RepID=UPI000703D7BA|nr:caspase-10 isoform X1 [Tupaia chinensis]
MWRLVLAPQGQSLTSGSDENSKMTFREKLLNIDSNLGVQDVECLKFLCLDFISQKKLEKSSSASDIFDHLMAEELLSEEDPFFLAELLYIIKQNSLLRHLNYTREAVENLLPTRRRVSLFRNLLYEISEGIDSDNLRDMIFLLGEKIPKKPKTSLSLLAYLEQQAEIDDDNLMLLENLCKRVVPHLLKKIENYRRNKAAEEATPVVNKETESSYPEEEEIVSFSSIKQLSEFLPVSSVEAAVYRMDRKHRGHCVIVNNYKFTTMTDRPGTHKDAECLEHVFQWLGFTVHMYDDVTEEGMENLLQEYKRHPGHVDADCFVFCILTHGKFGAVYSSDGVLIPIRKIMAHFTAHQCPGLAHKPKLFFIQACQGEEVQPFTSIEADAQNPDHMPPPLKDSIPVEADFLLGLATVPGYVSFRHVMNGSWYIQSLCTHLTLLVPRHEDILSILTVVNDDVSQRADSQGTKKQMPQPAFTLRKKLVFPVPRDSFC